MKVTVKLLATFRDFLPQPAGQSTLGVDVAADETIRDLLKRLGLPDDLPRVILVNGHYAAEDGRLSAGDVVSIFPPLIGGR